MKQSNLRSQRPKTTAASRDTPKRIPSSILTNVSKSCMTTRSARNVARSIAIGAGDGRWSRRCRGGAVQLA